MSRFCDCLKCFNFSGSAVREGVVIQGITSASEFNELLALSDNTFNQLDVTETVRIPEVKPDVEQINQMQLEVCLKDAWISPNGNKILIKGVIWQKIMYTACVENQPVHTVENKFPFSHFVDITGLSEIQIAALRANPANYVALAIEDAFVQMENGRNLFKNVIVTAFILRDLLPRG